MTDQQKRARDEAAEQFHKDKYTIDERLQSYSAETNRRRSLEEFEAGADYWHARAKLLEATLIDTSNCNSCEKCSNAAREALTRYRDGGGAV